MIEQLSRRQVTCGLAAAAGMTVAPLAASATIAVMPGRQLEDFFGKANMADLRVRLRESRFWEGSLPEAPPVLGSDGAFRLSSEARIAYSAFLFEGREVSFASPWSEMEHHHFILHALRRYGLVGNMHEALEGRASSPPYREMVVLTTDPVPSLSELRPNRPLP